MTRAPSHDRLASAKCAIVIALERGCSAVDHLWFWPPPFWWIARWADCRLANWSAELDQRWNTGVWEDA